MTSLPLFTIWRYVKKELNLWIRKRYDNRIPGPARLKEEIDDDYGETVPTIVSIFMVAAARNDLRRRKFKAGKLGSEEFGP